MQVDEHDTDVLVHDEFASDDAPLDVDALEVVTHDVTWIPGVFLHIGLDDLNDDDLSVILLYDVDFLLFDDYDVKVKWLIASSADG